MSGVPELGKHLRWKEPKGEGPSGRGLTSLSLQGEVGGVLEQEQRFSREPQDSDLKGSAWELGPYPKELCQACRHVRGCSGAYGDQQKVPRGTH